MRLPVVLLSLLTLALLYAAPAPAAAQEEAAQDAVEAIEARRARIAELEAAIGQEAADLVALGDEVRALRREAEAVAVPLRTQIEELRADLDRLGPAPEAGVPEEPVIAERRRALLAEIARVDAALRQAELNLAAAGRISLAITEARREAFTDQVLARGPSPLLPGVLAQAGATLMEGAGAAQAAAQGWLDAKAARGERDDAVISLLIAVLLATALFLPVRRYINRLIFKRIERLEPLPSRRVLVAAIRTAARTIPGLLGGFFVFEALRLNSVIPPEGEALAAAFWIGFITLLFADGAVNAVFAPKLPAWRVAPLSNKKVLQVRTLLLSAALVVSLDMILRRGAELFATSPELALVQEGATAVALGILLVLLCRNGLWRREEDTADALEPKAQLVERPAPPGAPEAPAAAVQPGRGAGTKSGTGWGQMRLAGRLAGAVAVVAALLGYVHLGHYLTTRAFGLLALFGAIWALRALMREGVRLVDRRFSSKRQEEAQGEEKLLYSWIGIAIDLLALCAFVPPALLILGAEWSDVRGWLSDAFFGFEIGTVRISLAKILAGLGVFLVLIWVTKGVQKTADTQFFPRSRIDTGVQNSLRTLIGYLGLVIAFAAAVGTLGFDLGNLAIIAGALSVGIGFGLQSIVNNFVSGLILLFERPIKVGDWIVTASGEGIVKRISVRSTEIETFDRSSVIVPNSELISSSVTNWTHKDKMGRLVIGVGASYSSDAAKVISVLEDIARRSPDVLYYPAPFVVFEDFGASSLDFTLRAYIRDVGDSLKVRTRLRVAIHERFREEGIEIPFPQQDVHLKEIPARRPHEMTPTADAAE